jgi:hypothetical protein
MLLSNRWIDLKYTFGSATQLRALSSTHPVRARSPIITEQNLIAKITRFRIQLCCRLVLVLVAKLPFHAVDDAFDTGLEYIGGYPNRSPSFVVVSEDR